MGTFKQMLADMELVGENTGNVILAKIKNTMSDWHIVEKNFNCLLEEYRSTVLPSVVESWNALSCDQQLFLRDACFSDTASATLCQWEATHFEGAPVQTYALRRKSESGRVRLIRTACKAFSKHGSEQSGVYLPFTSFLASNETAWHHSEVIDSTFCFVMLSFFLTFLPSEDDIWKFLHI